MACPRCGFETRIFKGRDGRTYSECCNPTCTFNYNNASREMRGRQRHHFKLSPADYVSIHKMEDEKTIGKLAYDFGISRKQVRRILNLNLSDYAVRVFGEPPINGSEQNVLEGTFGRGN